MSLRHEWTFETLATTVLAAARARVAYHTAKVATWKDREAVALSEYQASVGISESYSYGSQTRTVATPTSDPKKAQALSEAQGRVRHHEEQVKTYTDWEQALARGIASGQNTLSLHYDDLVFFGMNASSGDEE